MPTKTTSSLTETRYIPTNELLAEYFSKRTEQVPFEETKDEFVFHVPKAFVVRWFDEYLQVNPTSNDDHTRVNTACEPQENELTLEEKKARMMALAGSWVGDFPERIQPIANERMELI